MSQNDYSDEYAEAEDQGVTHPQYAGGAVAAPKRFSPFVPVLILSLTVTILLGFQFQYSQRAGDNLRKQLVVRKKAAEEAVATKAALEKIAVGLLDLGADDRDARLIIEKHQIRRTPKEEAAP